MFTLSNVLFYKLVNRFLIIIVILIYTLFNKSLGQTSIELHDNWRFCPDEQNRGITEKWYAMDFNDTKWVKIAAGKRWEDQGYSELDAYAWFRKVVNIPSEWKGKKVWLLLGGVNDSYVLFINGKRINSFGDQIEYSIAEKPTVTEISRYLNYGTSNLITLQVYDWGGSGGIWRLPCELTIDSSELKFVPLISCYMVYQTKQLWVESDISCLGNETQGGSLSIVVRDIQDNSVIAKREQEINNMSDIPLLKIDFPQIPDQKIYQLTAKILDISGNLIISSSEEIEWEKTFYPREVEQQPKVLNNFVTELVNINNPDQDSLTVEFSNPRQGWVFISVSTSKNNSTRFFLNNESNPLAMRVNPETGALEAMEFLAKGKHVLKVESARSGQIIVRSIPEIIYSDHPSSPHITPYGKYDWAYLEKYVLSNVNTIVTSATSLADSEVNQWVNEGRKWIVHSGLPGLNRSKPPAAEEVYDVWAQNPGVTDRRFNGIIIDEFLMAGTDHYNAWIEAVNRIYQNPDFVGKIFYAYCGDIFSLPTSTAIPFGRKLIDLGGRIAMERYLPEQSNEEESMRLLLRQLQKTYNKFTDNIPGGEKHLIFVLGYLSDATESLNRDPSVNYKTFMDMQFHLLATDPSFRNLYGIQEYLSSYADEEVLRWAHRLFRHYCIEGRRNRFSNDPYHLPHLENPDFTEGLSEWQIAPAEQGSIQAKNMSGYSWLQGRYPHTSQGDQFAWFKRSSKGSNMISQKIRELDPSRLYSLKLISADLQNLAKKQQLALSIKIDNVDLVDKYCFQFVYPSNYAHELGPYNRQNPAWMNYHRIVFKPKSTTAFLHISDWIAATDPGGPVGQELIFNFIEVQPFYE